MSSRPPNETKFTQKTYQSKIWKSERLFACIFISFLFLTFHLFEWNFMFCHGKFSEFEFDVRFLCARAWALISAFYFRILNYLPSFMSRQPSIHVVVKCFIFFTFFLRFIFFLQSYLRLNRICGLIVNVMNRVMFLWPTVVHLHHDLASSWNFLLIIWW